MKLNVASCLSDRIADQILESLSQSQHLLVQYLLLLLLLVLVLVPILATPGLYTSFSPSHHHYHLLHLYLRLFSLHLLQTSSLS